MNCCSTSKAASSFFFEGAFEFISANYTTIQTNKHTHYCVAELKQKNNSLKNAEVVENQKLL